IIQRLLAAHVEDADDFVPELANDPLDRLSHLAVAVQRELHAGTACSNSAAWICWTARSESPSSTTMLRFRPERPRESIFIEIPCSASKTRAPTRESLSRLRPTMAMMLCSSVI